MKDWMPKEIKDLRVKYKLSQPKFGTLLGVTGTYVYLLEKGVKKPSKTLKILLGFIEGNLRQKKKGKEDKKYG